MSDGSGGRRSFDISPHQERSPAYTVYWDRATLIGDLKAAGIAPEEREKRADSYFANFRLLLDRDGVGFVDSLGQRHPVPPATARMVTVNFWGPVMGTPGDMRSDQSRWLVFSDHAGQVTQLLPQYGWNIDEVVAWAHEVGWDTEVTIDRFEGTRVDQEKAFPGLRAAPRAPAGVANHVPAPPMMSRLRRRLGL